MVHGGVKQTQILHAELIVTLYQAAPESVGRAKMRDRATENDNEPPRRVKGPKGIGSMLDTPTLPGGSGPKATEKGRWPGKKTFSSVRRSRITTFLTSCKDGNGKKPDIRT